MDLQRVLAVVRVAPADETPRRQEAVARLEIQRDAPQRRLVVRDLRDGDPAEADVMGRRQDHDPTEGLSANERVGVARDRAGVPVARVRRDERPHGARPRHAACAVQVAHDVFPERGGVRRIPGAGEHRLPDDRLGRIRADHGDAGREEEEAEEQDPHGSPRVAEAAMRIALFGAHLNGDPAC